MNFHKTNGSSNAEQGPSLSPAPSALVPSLAGPCSSPAGAPVFWRQWGRPTTRHASLRVWLVLSDIEFVKSIHIFALNCCSFTLIIFRVPIVNLPFYCWQVFRLFAALMITDAVETMLGIRTWVRLFSHRAQPTWISIYISINCVWKLITLYSCQHSIFSSVLSFDSSQTK